MVPLLADALLSGDLSVNCRAYVTMLRVSYLMTPVTCDRAEIGNSIFVGLKSDLVRHLLCHLFP